MNSNIGIVNLEKFAKKVDGLNKAPEKVLSKTVSEFKTRAPGWIADSVRERYNIAKNEIVPAKINNKAPIYGGRIKAAGSVSITGRTIGSVCIIYKGRRLTPVHFSMTPKAPRPTYTLKAEIIKGQRKKLGQIKRLTKKQKKNVGRNFTHQSTRNSNKSPIMLMHTGNKQSGGVDFIPFQRQSQRRDDIKAIKTVSLPRMIKHETVSKRIEDKVNEELGKRFDHHLQREFKKYM